MSQVAPSRDTRPTEPRKTRFIDTILADNLVQTEVIKGFVGRRLRANRLVQSTNGRSGNACGIDHTLVYHIGGGKAERFDGRKCTGTSEKLRATTLMPARQENNWDLPDGVDVLHLYLDDHDLRHFAASEFGFDPARLELRDHMGVDDPFMHHLGPLVLAELRSDLPQTQLMLDGFDAVVAGHMLRAYSNMSQIVLETEERARNHHDADVVHAARELLLDRLDENLSAKEIGQMLDISPYRLMRLFKREVGVSMHQFVMQERVAQVFDRLKHTDDPLVEIAYDAGFSSQAHMSSVYTKVMGVSPGRHRASLRS